MNADNVSVFPESKSPISLAFLDDNNEAEYIFYKDHAHDQLEYVYPEIHQNDIVIFGSFFAVNPVIRPQVVGLLDYARSHGAIIYYDVNFRPSHKDDVMRITPNFLENLEYADFVRGSREDFETLYKMDDPDKVYASEISFYCKKFIFTNGAKPVVVHAESGLRKTYPALSADTVSTVGAGDNFNAGFVYGLIREGITRQEVEQGLAEEQWNALTNYAQMFSADCCKSLNNYVSKEFGQRMQTELKGSEINNEQNNK